VKPISFLIAFSFLFGMVAIASDIKDVSVLTDRVLVVHFSDGFIEYHGYHQTGEDDITIKYELDVNAASVLANYSITSSDDPKYKKAVNPLKIGRKSKPSGMSMKCMPNDQNRCMSDYVLEHYIYLFLDKQLQPGKPTN
jgi:hypothetical protein